MGKELDSGFMEHVAATYKETGTLQKTAKVLGMAYAKVRKILITMGEYKTPYSEDIKNLHRQGYSAEEIAVKLGTTAQCVSAWLPYQRSMYNPPQKSHEAQRSENYRARIGQAQKHFVSNMYQNNNEQGETMKILNMKEKNTGEVPENESMAVGEPMRLHLRLTTEFLNDDEQRILKSYGHSSDGFSIQRDILVPSDMPLHNLHYAIQRLFGWQNSHLRAFRLPDDVYARLTNNTVRGWGELIGVLFQTVYSEYMSHERYADDDYEAGSIKTWLRRKYTGPYSYVGKYELYNEAVYEFQRFVKQLANMDVYSPFGSKDVIDKVIKKAPAITLTLQELNESIIMEGGTEDLLERLLVSSVLAPVGRKLAVSEDLNKKTVKRYYDGYGTIDEPEVEPVTDMLFYHYDYGDGWIVEITRLENCDDLYTNESLNKMDFDEARNLVMERHKPVCLHQDGVFVLDDVGGVTGFINMLQTLYESDDLEEKKEMKEWAYGFGWNTRKIGNKTLL